MCKSFAAFTMALVLSSCGGQPAPAITSSAIATGACPEVVGTPIAVAVSELTSSPGRYELKPVSVTGYYFSAFELSAIYPANTRKQVLDPKRGVWVSPLPKELTSQTVHLVGYFTQTVKGHGGQWSGAICVASARPASQDAP